MVSSQTASSTGRTMRQVVTYATRDGEQPLKKRAIEAFAPSVRAAASIPSGESTTTLSGATLEMLRALNAPNRVSKTVSQAARLLAAAAVPAGFQLRRMEFKQSTTTTSAPNAKTTSATANTTSLEHSVADAVAIGALESHHASSASSLAGDVVVASSTVIVVEGGATATRIAARLKAVYQMSSVLLLVDGSVQYPNWPTTTRAAPAEGATAQEVCESLVVVIATVEGLLGVQKRSAIWKHLGKLVIVATAGLSAQLGHSAVAEAVRNTRACIPARVAIVAGGSLSDISSPDVESLAARPSSSAVSTSSAKRSSSVPPTPCEMFVDHLTIAGPLRFQSLYALILAQARASDNSKSSTSSHVGAVRSVVVVQFATAEAAAFWCDVIMALNELPSSASLICDSEDPAETRKADRSTVEASIMSRVDGALRSPTGGAVIVLTSFGIIPPAVQPATDEAPSMSSRRYIFVQYDPLLHIDAFHGLVGERLSGGGVTASAYHSVVLFLRPNESSALTSVLQSTPQLDSPTAITYRALPRPSVATSALLSTQRMKALHKKMFTIANRAFEAFRATMHVYSRLHPKQVYDVTQVDLDLCAAEFGFDEAPLLDLRTKATQFRPAEDWKKASVKRLVADRRAKKRYADEEIIGEGPEEHIVPELNETE